MTSPPGTPGESRRFVADRPGELVEAILAATDHPTGRPVVLIDGGSGSGKTTLAHGLAERLGGWRVISLDDCYPGWFGLAEGADLVPGMLTGAAPGYRRWDWWAGAPGPWVPVDPDQPLVIEGCGSLTPANRALATLGLWCQLDPESRLARATRRDGTSTRDWWAVWGRQEHRHWAEHLPRTLADLEVSMTDDQA